MPYRKPSPTPPPPRGQPRIRPYRELINAILYVLCEGVKRRALPDEFPPWPTVYAYFRDWQDDGTWQRIHDALRESDRVLAKRGEASSAGIIDSQTVKTTEKGEIGAMRAPSAWWAASATWSWIPTGGWWAWTSTTPICKIPMPARTCWR